MEDSQETELLFSMRAFVATFLTLQWLKGNQTAKLTATPVSPGGFVTKLEPEWPQASQLWSSEVTKSRDQQRK